MPDIRHLVVLMQENRSFDHMLGYLRNSGMAIDGVTGATNQDSDGRPVKGYHLESTRVRIRPAHEREHVVTQVNEARWMASSEAMARTATSPRS
jgi:phospholipase C